MMSGGHLPAALAAIRAGRWAEAAQRARQARAAAPQDPGIPLTLGDALAAAGRPLDALSLRLAAWRIAPADLRVRQALALGCVGIRLTQGSPLVETALSALLRDPELDPQLVAPSVTALLEARPVADWLRHPLGRSLLLRALVAAPAVEQALTALRRRALLKGALTEGELVPLAAQAALGCRAWAEEPAETAAVLALAADPPPQWDRRLLLLAAYRTLPAPAVAAPADPDLALLHDRLIRQPQRQRALAAGLPTLAAAEGETSRQVKRQYEENPYPRWTGVLRQAARPLPQVLRGLFPDLKPLPDDRRPLRVLVAGCGTGAHALRVAARYAGAEVLALDLSRAALGYAAMKAEALGAANIRFAEADLLRLGGLDERFELIECAGVLHHLAEPAEGLAVLKGLLAPQGVMKLGLYARRARRSIEAARAVAASVTQARDPAALRTIRQALLALPDSHPAAPVTRLLDFQSLDGLRDLVLHVQETSYDPPGLKALLDGAGLDFVGFELADAGLAARFRQRFPGRERDLAAWDSFEAAAPDSFVTMYQFWCRPR